MQQATSTIPIVMAYSTDPVGSGFVATLARPGGNTTGLASSQDDAAPKQLELLAMAVPQLRRIGLLGNPSNPNAVPVLRAVQAAARAAGLVVVPADARSLQEIDKAFGALTSQSVAAVIVLSDAFFSGIGEQSRHSRSGTGCHPSSCCENTSLLAGS